MRSLGLASALAAIAHVSAQGLPPALVMTAYRLEDPLAVCLDGTPAIFYQRNCTANWDRKPGDPTDFCDVPVHRWILHFSGAPDRAELEAGQNAEPSPPLPVASAVGGAFCYDASSCAARSRSSPNATTSAGLPASAFPGGITLPFAEVNPNLYKAATVHVPYCSSDLWAGNATSSSFHFRGAAIANAVIDALFSPPIPAPRLDAADEVIVIGTAGIMARLDELAERMLALKRQATGNHSATLSVMGVCDGCLLLDSLSPLAATCTTDRDCPPQVALLRAQLAWGLRQQAVPPWCAAALGPAAQQQAWRCLAASVLGPALSASSLPTAAPRALAAATSLATPVLVQQQAFDRVQLAMSGAWPPSGPGAPPNASAWATGTFAPAARAALASLPFSFSSACDSPPGVSLRGAYYHTMAQAVSAYNFSSLQPMSVALPTFLSALESEGASSYGRFGDTCDGFDCNPSGCHD